MKKNILLIVAIALVGTVTFTLNNLRAQDQPAPGAPPVVQVPPPNMRPGPPLGSRIRPGMNYRTVIVALQRVKADLERSTEDYDGHRQSAIAACDKAAQELEAVQASILAAAKAKAAAAAAAAQQAPSAAPATAPAPPQ